MAHKRSGAIGNFIDQVHTAGLVDGHFAVDQNGKCDGDGPATGTHAFRWQRGVMSDLNTLSPGSPLFLLFAMGINSRGEIVGFGVTGTGDVHGFPATPKNGEEGGDREGDSAGRDAHGAASPMVLTEDARNLLQQRLPFGRFGTRVMGPR